MVTPTSVLGRNYIPKGDHRDGTPLKSQWTIPVTAELETFRQAIASGWVAGQLAWGLHLAGQNAGYLGTYAIDPGPADPLFIALFELAQVSHGYPSDHRRSTKEKPPPMVLRAWIAGGFLRKAVVRKIGRGQRCAL